MRRLIYAPKAYIFIRSSNLNGKVFDVSSDVTGGEVTQVCGDMSTATFTLKNRYQKWIRDPSQEYLQIFLPMDMVSIWLQRIAGKPIQVFTGYLDAVPYYQAYSGDVNFEATCTLKKLKYTWFDPGLPFFQQWVNSQDGWTYDVTSGEALKPSALAGTLTQGGGPGTATGSQASINDSGFADLLGRFMTEIAGWDSTDVLISSLPPDIPKIAAQLFQQIEADTDQDLTAFSQFMGQTLGVNGWQGSGQPQTTTATGAAVQPNPAIQLAAVIAQEASNANIPPLVCLFAAQVLSGMNASKSKNQGTVAGNNWGYGLYSLQPQIPPNQLGIQAQTPEGAKAGPQVAGYLLTDLLDPATATAAFCKLLNQAQSQGLASTITTAKSGDMNAIILWIQVALGRTLPTNVDLSASFAAAKKLATSSNVVMPVTNPNAPVDPSTMTWADDWLQKAPVTDQDRAVIKTYYAKSQPWLAGIFWQAKKVSPSIALSFINNQTNDAIVVKGTAADLKSFYATLAGSAGSNLDLVQFQSAGTATSMVFGTTSNTQAISNLTVNSVYVQETSQPSPGSQTSSAGASTTTSTTAAQAQATSTGQGGASFEEIAAFSANAAFAANFSFPADYLLATFLTGDRALMNDTSCLDAVKQFCQASLREFRSLPDGRFCAFYPDYFGAHRDPYWSIRDIEIIDFGIQLNDEALATHVYVVGDTGYPDGQIDDLDSISTRGVATINQAMILDSFIEAYDPNNPNPALGRLIDSVAFLNQYGARPYMEEDPMIRNTYYEFLMAWQRFMQLWASQFATDATFTFQPEVMAGGLISFPDHGIQMYCDTVTHSWDYENGFTTQATLSSPSLLAGTQADRTWKPGFALAGNVNTVGVSAGG